MIKRYVGHSPVLWIELGRARSTDSGTASWSFWGTFESPSTACETMLPEVFEPVSWTEIRVSDCAQSNEG